MEKRRLFLRGFLLLAGASTVSVFQNFSFLLKDILPPEHLPFVMDVHFKILNGHSLHTLWDSDNQFIHRDRILSIRSKYIEQNLLKVVDFKDFQNKSILVRHYFASQEVLNRYLKECSEVGITKNSNGAEFQITSNFYRLS